MSGRDSIPMPAANPNANNAPHAIILAAGQGNRMGADLPKVLHHVAGRPMICWVIEACRDAGVSRIVVVTGYRGQDVRNTLAEYDNCQFVEQPEQLGTGHAALMAEPVFADHPPTDVFVLAGDAPLIRATTLTHLLEEHRSHNAHATLATAVLDNPVGYGHIMRDPQGRFQGIIEHKDATDEQKKIREINPSYYCFHTETLFDALHSVRNDNAQAEYYLTDVPGQLQKDGHPVTVVDAVPPEDVLGVNTLEQLKQVDRVMRTRLGILSYNHAG